MRGSTSAGGITGGYKPVSVPGNIRTEKVSNNAIHPQPTHLAVFYQWAAQNKPVAIAVGVCTVVIVFAILWKMTGKNDSSRNVVTNPKITTVIAPTVATAPTPSVAPALTQAPSTIAAITKVPDVDPRADKAMRDWKAIKELADSGKANPYDIRKRLDAFMEPFWIRKTDLGIEAAKLLEKYKGEKRPADKADGAVPGVTAAIALSKDFMTDVNPIEVKTLKEINFPNLGALKANFGRDENFCAKITGFIEVPTEGKYALFITSDDGSMLYIGDNLLVDNNGSHAMTERDGSVELKPGKHRFRLDYYNGMGEGGLIFSWSGPNITKQVVPASALSSIPKK